MNKVIKMLVLAGLVSTATTGCGSLFGVRNFELWEGGTRWEFMEGQDFHIGMNGIDNVQNERGVTRGTPPGTKPEHY